MEAIQLICTAGGPRRHTTVSYKYKPPPLRSEREEAYILRRVWRSTPTPQGMRHAVVYQSVPLRRRRRRLRTTVAAEGGA